MISAMEAKYFDSIGIFSPLALSEFCHDSLPLCVVIKLYGESQRMWIDREVCPSRFHKLRRPRGGYSNLAIDLSDSACQGREWCDRLLI